MKGRIARITAAALALLLTLSFFLLPGREERELPTNSGHQKWQLEEGDSFSCPWTPALAGSNELRVYLKGLKKAREMTLTAVLTDAAGAEAAAVTQAVAELGEEDSLRLTGSFQQGTAYTLTVTAAGEGTVSLQGDTDEEGAFLPALKESGIVVSRNPVLLYFALGLALLAAAPVTGPDPERRIRRRKRTTVASLLPWGTFGLIFGVSLLVALRKPAFLVDDSWATWDEDVHSYWVLSQALVSGGGLRKCLNSVITWHPGYLPLSLGYNLGELIGLVVRTDAGFAYRCAVIMSALCYAGMCALAVKHAPRYKVSFFLAGSIPLMIFQATSMTYDTAVAGSVLLGTALLLETLAREERLSTLRAMTLLALFSLGTVAKPAYSLTLLSLLLIPAARFGGGREKWLFRICAVCLMVWCFAAMKMPGAYDDVLSGDLRFSDKNAGAQIQGMLADPLGSGLKPVRYAAENLYFLTAEWMDFWAYVDYGLPGLRDLYLILMLLAAPLCTCGESWTDRSPLTPGRRVTLGLIVALAELALIYAQYIASSPVGGAVTGMQPRYFIPLWAPALLAVMWPHGIRKRAAAAGEIMTVIVFALCLGANLENALIHLRNLPLI